MLISKFKTYCLMTCLLLLIFSSFATSDIYFGPTTIGENLENRESEDIQLVDEIIDIILGENNCFVTGLFNLKNHSSEIKRFKVSFPLANKFGFGSRIENFEISINGANIEPKEETKEWISWDMEFGPQESVSVLIRYNASAYRETNTRYFGKFESPWLTFDWKIFNHDFQLKKDEDLLALIDLLQINQLQMYYILKTGASWYKNIEKVEVNIKANEEIIIKSISPENNYILKNGLLRWMFNDVNPNFDLTIFYYPRGMSNRKTELIKELKKRYPKNSVLTKFLDGLNIDVLGKDDVGLINAEKNQS